MTLSPAVRILLRHAIDCNGAWLPCDPIRMHASTVEAAERRGLVRVERLDDGAISCASITAKGRAYFRWHPDEGGHHG